MTSRLALLASGLALAALAAVAVGTAQTAPFADAGQAADARRQAEQALARAQARAAKLEQAALVARAAADRTANETAAVAARIQQSEAEIALAQDSIASIDRQRAALRLRIAQRQEPVVRLTAALQLMARRPLVFSLMRADSLHDTVYLRAVLETMLPQVQRRTAGLRSEIVRGRQLQEKARAAQAHLLESRKGLGARKLQLVALESRQRIDSRSAQGSASREADRALALAEETRDLGTLMSRLQQDGALRERLAALPGPVPRPTRAGDSIMPEAVGPLVSPPVNFGWILPVTGRVVTGFGEASAAGATRGVTFAPPPGAQVVSPAAGRIAFAGAYRGFGRIVIIEHEGGWSSLVTDLGTLAVSVGQTVVQGSPLGDAGPGHPRVTVELRKDGNPVNPLDFLKG